MVITENLIYGSAAKKAKIPKIYFPLESKTASS